MNAFAKTFRKYRVEQEITLRKISEVTNKSIAFWSDVEHGRRLPPTKEIVEKVENLFGIDNKSLSNLAQAIRETPDNFNYLIKTSPEVTSLAQMLLHAQNELSDDVLKERIKKMQKIIKGEEE